MTIDEVIRRIGEIGIVPVVRAQTADDATRAVEAISVGGIPIIEITMTVPNALAVIAHVASRYGHQVLVGAGTVISAEQTRMCIESGAEFLVSPGLSVPVLACARDAGKLAIPGALTPTEVMNAWEHGMKLVKIFPCGNVGGAKYLKALKGPFPDACLIPTGGVSVANAAEFLAAGAFALGVGGELVNAAALRTGNTAQITHAAKELVHAVRSARKINAPSGIHAD
jgi:2-dehydro-3-deoxyphosphogluconate aldolase/(4S)-4-hydroxy-2-oxoglutarate aldolase